MFKALQMVTATVMGGVLGCLLIPLLVYGVTAALHYLRFGHMQEFWGLLLAIQSVPIGFVLGATITYFVFLRR